MYSFICDGQTRAFLRDVVKRMISAIMRCLYAIPVLNQCTECDSQCMRREDQEMPRVQMRLTANTCELSTLNSFKCKTYVLPLNCPLTVAATAEAPCDIIANLIALLAGDAPLVCAPNSVTSRHQVSKATAYVDSSWEQVF